MSKYVVTIYDKDNHPDYIITIDAEDPESAYEKAVKFLIENAWWSGWMSDDDKRKQLSNYTVKEIEE